MKKSDGLVDQLAGLAREEERRLADLEQELGPELEQLTHGDLSSDQQQALATRAASDSKLSVALPLYSPLPATAQESFLAVARAGLRASAKAPEASSGGVGRGTMDELAIRRRRRWLAVSSLSGLAATAVLLLFVLRSSDLAPMPDYELELTGGEGQVRGEPGGAPNGVVRLHDGAELELVLRPERDAPGPIQSRAFVRLPSGSVQPLELPIEISPAGAVRVAGPVSRLFPDMRGPLTLVLLLSTAGASVPDAVATGGPEVGPGWRRVMIALELLPAVPGDR